MTPAPYRRTPANIGATSDVGSMRQTNEDAFSCDWERSGYVAIADGVGGLEYGERASAAAVAGFREILSKEPVPARERPDFVRIFRALDAQVDALGEKIVPGFGIATTLDVAVDGGNGVIHFAHLGDSGIFLFRGNALVRLSEEHTLAAEEIARGNRDFPAAYLNTLTRALGVGECCEPQVFSLATQPGDRILLATDGITRTLSPEKIESLVGDSVKTPQAVAESLIAAANEAGGFDNSTAVVAFF